MGEKILTIKLTETLLYYDRGELQRWKDGDLAMLPTSERHRLSKYQIQCYVGNHFPEVCVMRELEQNGFRWYYENYKIFHEPSKNARAREGYIAAREHFGTDAIREAQSLGGQYDFEPKEPDLFAINDASHLARFIEVKRDDPVHLGQLLALAIILEILKCSVEIIRLVPRGSTLMPKSYEWIFDPKQKESREPPSCNFLKF
ncbi:MAG: hypothetical protein GTN76_10425 [Candidatus Aenigmarchaeota archaeon]|nr:hypothetical protein [Candidatus Aenigmarchaeota archaeon]